MAADPELLRAVSAVCHRLPVLETSAFKEEALQEETDALLLGYLSTLTKAHDQLNEVRPRGRVTRFLALEGAVEWAWGLTEWAGAADGRVCACVFVCGRPGLATAYGQVSVDAGPPRPKVASAALSARPSST